MLDMLKQVHASSVLKLDSSVNGKLSNKFQNFLRVLAMSVSSAKKPSRDTLTSCQISSILLAGGFSPKPPRLPVWQKERLRDVTKSQIYLQATTLWMSESGSGLQIHRSQDRRWQLFQAHERRYHAPAQSGHMCLSTSSP